MTAYKRLAIILAATVIAIPQSVDAKSLAPSKLWVGTWQLNTGKSKFSSSATTDKSQTRTYTMAGSRLSMQATATNAAGKVTNWSYSFTTDGKWAPAVGNPRFDRISVQLVNERELVATTMQGSMPSSKSTLTVSADGREMTVISTRGSSTEIIVFDRK